MEQTEASRKAVTEVWNNEFFIFFMALRFPTERNSDYIEQWKERIQDHRFGTFDKESRMAFRHAVIELMAKY